MQGLIGSVTGPIGADLADLEAAYASPTPWLRANLVATVDGAVELGGVSGAIGGPVDRELFVALRAISDAVLVGAGTARAEHYGPAWLRADAVDRRRARSQADLPTVVVVTGSGRLDPEARLFLERRDDQPAPPVPIVVTCATADPSRIEALGRVATVLSVGDETVDLAAAIGHLRGLGHHRIVCEGGPVVLGGLLAADLIDELCLTHAPIIAGPGRLTLAGSALGAEPVRLELTDLAGADGMLFARYRPIRSNPAATPPPLESDRAR
jgi:riboflavin biosynthesis pyrimidine reductase